MNIPDGMAPFDLAAAKAGAPICMRNGSVVTFDSHRPDVPRTVRIRIREEAGDVGDVLEYYETGKYYGDLEIAEDLFMDKRTEKKLQTFNLARAQTGDPICNRDGKPMKFVVYEPDAADLYRVMAMNKVGIVLTYDEVGRAFNNMESSCDLFMSPKKIIIWTRHYQSKKDGHIEAVTSRFDIRDDFFGPDSYHKWLGPAFKMEYDA